ncbi:MAG: 1-(5-phosphoribosyl)-5-[(5-phosphoribosylamino)methylideneamino]imidazole-4-carboxamide isomerase [Maricaulis sp.]|jgi:phosphoribosylformimino-5-aminoimidazole carboxamide ribotide isomerase|nr:1-(5-phosphoribosyl)-5-[(5-phosphoribosylamino)methylideneamino]imidazole-4-carboxamide isomerase [Maricaulis sp.]
MIVYPAIDILDGKVVRLDKGSFDAVTTYDDDPAKVAKEYRRAGVEWIHVVDLSGARDGRQRQVEDTQRICAEGVRIQSGGGVRSVQDVERLFLGGVDRVVIGSLAVSKPDLVSRWIRDFGRDKICLAFDVRLVGRTYRPALKGWADTASTNLYDTIDLHIGADLKHALVTDISKDGMLSGPNLELYADLVARYPQISWQASGGIASLEDIRAVERLGVAGVITGKAVYEGRFTVEEALSCWQNA